MSTMPPVTLDVLQTHPLVEDILDSHRDHALGDDRGWVSYRGHVYRVFNMARAVVPDRDDRDDRVVPRAIVRHLVRHPLDPLPIVRARRALRQAGHDGTDR